MPSGAGRPLAEGRSAAERLARIDAIHDRAGIGLAELDEALRCRRVNGALAAMRGLPAEACATSPPSARPNASRRAR